MSRIRGDLPDRTFRFAQAIIRIVDELPNNIKGREIGRQLIRSGTAIGSNVREADHAFTDADFAYKCSIARKEASETLYWLDLCQSCGLLAPEQIRLHTQEADELLSILSTIVRSTQGRIRETKSPT